MLSMLLIVRDRRGCCLSATVPSALNLTTRRRIHEVRDDSMSSIPSECPMCSYNGTVALKIKLNNQSSLKNRNSLNNRLIYPFSREKKKNIITLSNRLLFSVYTIQSKSPDFSAFDRC